MSVDALGANLQLTDRNLYFLELVAALLAITEYGLFLAYIF